MQSSDYQAFQELISDLCTAHNRPFTDDVVRVFWGALKDLPLGIVRNRAQLAQRVGKKFPSPSSLRPTEPEQKQDFKRKGPTVQERICEFAAKNYLPSTGRTTHWQFSQPWKYLYKRVNWVDKNGDSHDEYAECVGVVIPGAADGSKPSYKIMVEDMQLESAA